MKKFLSILCVLALTAALLAGCASNTGSGAETGADANSGSSAPANEGAQEPQEDAADPIDINIMALKGPTAMGMVQFMDQADTGALTDNHYHFTITAVTDEASAALGSGTTDIAAIPANLASVLYNNTDGAIQVLAINTLGVVYIVERGGTASSLWRTCGAGPSTPAARVPPRVRPELCADPERHRSGNGCDHGVEERAGRVPLRPAGR